MDNRNIALGLAGIGIGIGTALVVAPTVAAGVAHAGILGHRRDAMPLGSSVMGAACFWAARQGSGAALDAADEVAPTGDDPNHAAEASGASALAS